MSFFHKKNVTKCLGHHYTIWTSDSNILLAQNFFLGQPKAGPHFRHCIVSESPSLRLLRTTGL